MNGFASIHFEWVYSPENFFQGNHSIPYEEGTIEIGNGIVTAKIDTTKLRVDQSNIDESGDQEYELAEKLDDQIDELAQKIDDHIETLFHNEQKKTNKSYRLGLPFKIVVRDDGSEIVTPA